jgi:hypothetical protein
MEQGEKLPVCLGEANRPAEIGQQPAYPFLRKALGVLMCLQLSVLLVETSVDTNIPQEALKAMHVDFDKQIEIPQPETTTTTAQPKPKPRPTTTTSSTSTTTTLPPTTTTLAPTTTTQPSIYTTNVEPRKSCEETVSVVKSEVPVPEGWTFECTTISRERDGEAIPDTKTIRLYFGDYNDTFMSDKFGIAHEIGHAWQNEFGMWTAESANWVLCHQRIDSTTGQKVADNRDKYSPFCEFSLEHQADNFALAQGYQSNEPLFHHPTKAGARSICRYFAQYRDDLCLPAYVK